MEMTIKASGIGVSGISGSYISVSLIDIDIKEIISEIGITKILDGIDRDDVIKHFNIIEAE